MPLTRLRLFVSFRDKVEIFITGADAILEILTWKNVDRLAGMCRFIAATRRA